MDEWIPVTVNKIRGGKIALLVFSLSFNILFLLALNFLLGAKNAISLGIWGILTAFYFITAFLLPIWLYLRLPVKLAFTESEIIVKNRINKEKRILKSSIIKVAPMRAVISKEIIYGVYYNRKKTSYAISFDENSGRYVWEWYYGKEKNTEQREL